MRVRRLKTFLYIIAVTAVIFAITSCTGAAAPIPAPRPSHTADTAGSSVSPAVSETPSGGAQETDAVTSENPSAAEEPSSGTDDPPQDEESEESGAVSPPEETAEETASAEASGSPAENQYHPDGTKVAYITIDDGPSRNITPAILDLLMEEDIKATFFVLPHSGLDDIYRRIIDEGHDVGNHSYSHVYSKLYKEDDLQAFIDDALAARDFIYDNFGYLTTSYRFPGGSMGRKAEIIEPRRELLLENGYRWFDWNLSTGDADKSGSGKDASVLAANVLDNIRGRSRIIILMHDTSDKKATLEALPVIIAGLRERGYIFDTLNNYPPET